jgi:hypothetical protein
MSAAAEKILVGTRFFSGAWPVWPAPQEQEDTR